MIAGSGSAVALVLRVLVAQTAPAQTCTYSVLDISTGHPRSLQLNKQQAAPEGLTLLIVLVAEEVCLWEANLVDHSTTEAEGIAGQVTAHAGGPIEIPC